MDKIDKVSKDNINGLLAWQVRQAISAAARQYRRWAYRRAYQDCAAVLAGTANADGHDSGRGFWTVRMCTIEDALRIAPVDWGRICMYETNRGRRDAARAYWRDRHPADRQA